MQIKKGQNRIVFVFPKIGIVIKIPIVHFISFTRNVSFWSTSNCSLSEYFRLSRKDIGGPRRLLFKAIADNWGEFYFFLKTRHLFVQPTYFSFFGFFNIQKRGEHCNISCTDIWCQLHELTDGMVWKDSHHFAEPKNFCLDKGKLKIVDYGDPEVQEVITKYGMKIFDEFNPEYNCEEEKKKLKTKSTQGT